MNTIKSLKGKTAQGIVDYVENDQERKGEHGYYSGNGKAPSEWQGRGAEMLGLKGTVDSKVFKELLEKGPGGMEVGENRRMAAEIHWAPPKSVSMLIEAAPPEMRARLLDLCKEANRLNMQHIEDHVITARYGKGGAVSEKTGCALIASYQHDDARPVKQEDGSLKIDMQHHFHNIIINATHDGNEWRAMDLDFGALSVEQHLGDFKAKAFLAAELEKMGIATRKTKDGFEIAGINREQIEDNSGRSAEIEAALIAKGLTRETSTAAERNVANLDTRQSKLRDMSQDDLKWVWREKLREQGVDFHQLYDPQHDLGKISKSGQESTKDQEVFSTEHFSRSTTTEKEQHHERFIQHQPQELYTDAGKPGPGNSLQSLSECRLDANPERKGAGVLQSDARLDRSGDHALRRESAAEAIGGLTPEAEKQARAAIDAALDHLSEKDSLFDRRQLALEALKQGMGEVPPADIDAAMANHGRIVWAGEQTKTVERPGKDDGKARTVMIRAEMVTTVETVAREGWIQGYCAEGRGKLSSLMSNEQAQKAVEKAEKAQGFLFADDQKAAVIATLTTEDRVSAMIGGAGTGKTTAMKSMVDAARALGYETVGLTPSHGARQELLDAQTDKNITTASFLMQAAKPDQKPRLYILDEAGMVGDRTMQDVLRKLGPRDRILLSGDPDQMKPVEAGDPLQTLADKGVIHVSHLTKVQRQAKAEDKDLLALGQAWADRDTDKALALVRKYIKEVPVVGTGKPDKKAVDEAKVATEKMLEFAKDHGYKGGDSFADVRKFLDEKAYFVGLDAPQEAQNKITKEDRRAAIATGTVNEYMSRSEEDRARTMIICPTNDVRSLVNMGIRDRLQSSGALPANTISVTQLTKTDLSQKHMKEAHQYEPGQIMRTKEGKGAEARVIDYEIVGTDGQHNRLTLKAPDGSEKTISADKIDAKKWQVFNRQTGMGLALGEQIVIRDNSQKGIQNGDGGKIVNIRDGLITIQKDRDGSTVVLDGTKGLAIDYGYARTVNDSQGKSVDLPIMTGEASAGSSRNLLLVGTTRMRHGLVVITDHADGLIERSRAFADKNLAENARKNADLKTDRRLDRLDSILEAGKEAGEKEAGKQIQPEQEKSSEKAPEREEKREQEQQQEQERERQREMEMTR